MDAAADKKASDIVLIDLRNDALIADYFVLCNGNSSRQLRAIADGIVRQLREQHVRPLSVEGKPDSGWMLVDFGAVVVHVFSAELREYYNLDGLWENAPVVVHMQ